MSPYGPRFKLIFLDDTIYEGWMRFWFIFVHKDVLVIT